jgi:tetratricopeptide (TPR) repeat protein
MMTSKRTHTHRKHQEKIYKTIAVLLPFLIVILLEISLRIFHYGYNPDVFIAYPQNPEYFVFNPHASKRFFSDSRFAPSGNKELMRAKKDPNTLRFFVLGESTTIGYPYFHNGSFHRWLLYRLLHTYPDKHFEIINLSLTAVNSYTVKTFAEEIVRYEPDAVLIYSGQNEYYGGLGVASAQTLGSDPGAVNILLQMRQFRVVQWATNVYGSLRRMVGASAQEAETTRMELMIGDRQIPYRSELFEKGLRQFEYNMNATLHTLAKHHIPVFLSNVASNIKDLPPFVSDETDLANDAGRHYLMGQASFRNGAYEQAREYFTKAKETDLLRFRAPEALNQIVGDLCASYPQTYPVDSRKALEERAPHRLLGDELFVDHVHPNLTGYAIISEAFYAAIKASGILPPSPQEMTDEELERDMPVSPIDSLAGALRIMQLKAHFPFYDSLYINKPIPEHTTEEKLAAKLFRREADWMTVHSSLYQTYINQRRLMQTAKIAENTALEFAEDPVFYEQTAMLYGEVGDKETGVFYLRKSFDMQPSFGKAHYLTVFYLMLDRPEDSLPFLDYAIAHPDGKMKLEQLKPLVGQIIELKKQLAGTPTDASLLNRIAAAYLRMENKEGAAKYVRQALQSEPDNREALEMNSMLN